LGGTDVNNQLKLAALRYRQGQDYWTGPLSKVFAETTYENCSKYDRHFVTTQDMIREFSAWYEAGANDAANGTSTQSELFPEYEIPKIIKEWPAHGDVSQGQDYYLAPFYDFNEDGQVLIKLLWSSSEFPARIIPKKYLYSTNDFPPLKVTGFNPNEAILSKLYENDLAFKNSSKIIKYIPEEIQDKKSFATNIIEIIFDSQEQNLNENTIYDLISEIVVKRKNKFCLLSKATRRNLGCYTSKSGVQKREKQVQYFKHMEETSGVGAVAGFTSPFGKIIEEVQ
jgi:hypothetical protein